MVAKIIMGLYEDYFDGNLSHNLTLSWSNGASKSALLISMVTDLEFSNSDFTTTLYDPNRSSIPNFVEIGQETAEEISAIAGSLLFHAKWRFFYLHGNDLHISRFRKFFRCSRPETFKSSCQRSL